MKKPEIKADDEVRVSTTIVAEKECMEHLCLFLFVEPEDTKEGVPTVKRFEIRIESAAMLAQQLNKAVSDSIDRMNDTALSNLGTVVEL